MRQYIQKHRILTDEDVSGESPFYGIGEVTFDNLAASEGLAEDPQYVADVSPDEATFVDQSHFEFIAVTENVIRPSLGADASNLGDRTWSDKDAPNFVTLFQIIRSDSSDSGDASTLAEDLGAFRAIVNTPLDLGAAVREIRQYIWPTITAFRPATAVGAGAAALSRLRRGELLLALSERAI
jgi:hypothetical protein